MVRTAVEETIDGLKISTEAGCIIYEIRTEAEERVNDLNITIKHKRHQFH
jgi:predicted secreted Zn-dependent protease